MRLQIRLIHCTIQLKHKSAESHLMKEIFIHWVFDAFDFGWFVDAAGGFSFSSCLPGKPCVLRLEVFGVDVGWRVAVQEFALQDIRITISCYSFSP